MDSFVELPANEPEVFQHVEQHLRGAGFRVVDRALGKPWGGYWVIDESQAEQFAQTYFPGIDFQSLKITNNLSPKILLVGPQRRLSWQYHFRRAEIWRLIGGTAGVTTSDDDVERLNRTLQPGEIVRLRRGERHRLIGGKGWGMVAEIWQHTDPLKPSDESDIVRLQDDYRKI